MTADPTFHEANQPDDDGNAGGNVPVLRIAIADDDPDTLEMMGAMLRRPSVEIAMASSGAELVLLLTERRPFDLIVTDIDMPWAEGLAVIRSARASQVQVPVLFVSGLACPDLAVRVAGLGNARLLRKPLSAEVLRRTVAEMLGGAA
jgi:DNA-binding response OmpR family regulator